MSALALRGELPQTFPAVAGRASDVGLPHAGSERFEDRVTERVPAGVSTLDIAAHLLGELGELSGVHDESVAGRPTPLTMPSTKANTIGMTNTLKVEKTYVGKGAGRRTVWAVREYRMIGDIEVRETLGTYADEATAIARAAK